MAQDLLIHGDAELAEKTKSVQQLVTLGIRTLRECQRLRAEKDRLCGQLAGRRPKAGSYPAQEKNRCQDGFSLSDHCLLTAKPFGASQRQWHYFAIRRLVKCSQSIYGYVAVLSDRRCHVIGSEDLSADSHTGSYLAGMHMHMDVCAQPITCECFSVDRSAAKAC